MKPCSNSPFMLFSRVLELKSLFMWRYLAFTLKDGALTDATVRTISQEDKERDKEPYLILKM